jgi:aryl-alcohol dehydrogenase-like predicted oxidoreductase
VTDGRADRAGRTVAMAHSGLSQYVLLGQTGLRVSPLALGTMTFGNEGWGADEDASRQMFRRYVEAGGNFVDTANVYAQGRSEELLGAFVEESGWRDQLVLATKFTNPLRTGDPNAGGNGRKNIISSLDGSLRRLRTDYVDLYWLHAWDTFTPVEEVMSTFDALVRSGKVRAVGLSDVPAWYAAKAQTLARARGWEPIAALQMEYSLIERSIEREHVPAALDLGMGVTPWSPLASGFLTGKYTRSPEGAAGEGRVPGFRANGILRDHTDQDWAVLDALLAAAKDVDRSPAQVAINWLTHRPGVASTLLGARTVEQLEDNLAALDFALPDEHASRLDEAGRPQLDHPYNLFAPDWIRRRHGGADVRRRPA